MKKKTNAFALTAVSTAPWWLEHQQQYNNLLNISLVPGCAAVEVLALKKNKMQEKMQEGRNKKTESKRNPHADCEPLEEKFYETLNCCDDKGKNTPTAVVGAADPCDAAKQELLTLNEYCLTGPGRTDACWLRRGTKSVDDYDQVELVDAAMCDAIDNEKQDRWWKHRCGQDGLVTTCAATYKDADTCNDAARTDLCHRKKVNRCSYTFEVASILAG